MRPLQAHTRARQLIYDFELAAALLRLQGQREFPAELVEAVRSDWPNFRASLRPATFWRVELYCGHLEALVSSLFEHPPLAVDCGTCNLAFTAVVAAERFSGTGNVITPLPRPPVLVQP